MGVTTKVTIPEFGGKGSHTDVASAFSTWARTIMYYRDYYKGHYLMPLVVTSVKDNATEMFDFTCGEEAEEGEESCDDLGLVLKKMWEHYCGSYMFREQRNIVENLKQGTSEEVADFLVWVTNAVKGLGKEELATLRYEVFLNRVNKEIHHVLDSETVKHGQMTPTQMYTAVRWFETYVAHNERLEGKAPAPGQPRAWASGAPRYNPQFHKTTAFKAVAAEPVAPPSEGSKTELAEESESGESEGAADDPGGLFLPDFLGKAPDGDWEVHMRLAQVMQAEEKCQRRCFLCQSPDHLM